LSRHGIIATALLAALGALAACTQDFDQFEPKSSSTTGGTSSSASTGGGGGAGQGGGTVACSTDAQCDDGNACTTDACSAGACAHTAVADGPVPGGAADEDDCVDHVCTSGQEATAPDDTEIPDDGNPCTTDTCSGGSPMHANEPIDTSCGNGLFCDGAGNCAGCNKSWQCGDPGSCKHATCNNHVCDVANDDAGTDCAGGKCDGSGACVECTKDSDCFGDSAVCVNQKCVDSCSDGTKDGDETDLDCGGSCSDCADGKACDWDGDCQSHQCEGNVCVQDPQCMNGVKDGTETDVDCGGFVCAGCGTNKACFTDGDCASQDCKPNHTCS
jgi:hypothetical protein